VAKRMRPISDYGYYMSSMIENWGPYIDESMVPATHLDDSACKNFLQAMAFDLHINLLNRVNENCHVIKYGQKKISFPDPIIVGLDGWSRDLNGFQVFLLRHFVSKHSFHTKWSLWRLHSTHGVLRCDKDEVKKRDSSGSGLYNTFIHKEKYLAFYFLQFKMILKTNISMS